MTDLLTQPLRPSPDAAESAVGDETVLLHLVNGTYYGLDAVGTRIWAMLKDGDTPAAICARLVEDYGIDLTTAREDVCAFLTDLKAHDIVIDG